MRPSSELYWFSEGVEKFHNNRYFVSLWRYLRGRQENIFAFFQELLALCHASGFFQLAATQELMCTKLVELASGRDDRELIVELLRYDWLRCGFRFLPECLKVDSSNEQPEKPDLIFIRRCRRRWKAFIGKTSQPVLSKILFFTYFAENPYRNLAYLRILNSPCLCVLQEREVSLYAFNKVMIF